MPSFASVAGEHLAGIGLAPGLLSSFTQNLKADDILGIAIRVALIGLVAAGVRKLLTSLKTAITDSKSFHPDVKFRRGVYVSIA